MCLYIGMAIFGIIAIVRGRLPLSRNKIVVGIPARLLGVLAFTPLPLTLVMVTTFMAVKGGLNNPEQFERDNSGAVIGIQLACTASVLIVMFVIGFWVGVSPKEAKRRALASRYGDYEDDDRRDRRSRDRRSRDRDEDDERDERNDPRDRRTDPDDHDDRGERRSRRDRDEDDYDDRKPKPGQR